MRKGFSLVVFLAPGWLAAQEIPDTQKPEHMTVTSNPLGSDLFELVTPVETISESDLARRSQSTLGETLNSVPGINSSYFGPNASRPIIRGQEGDRIRIMENGIGSLDASALSPDHAAAVDPLILDRLEVVRGPAALLYGGSAVGGVVNQINNRIPSSPAPRRFLGRTTLRFGGPDQQKSGAAVIEGGNENFAVHVDAYRRSTENVQIPGYARSEQLRLTNSISNESKGTIPNT